MRWVWHKANKRRDKKCLQNFKKKDHLQCLGEYGGWYKNDSCVNILVEFELELCVSARDRSCVLVDQAEKKKLRIS